MPTRPSIPAAAGGFALLVLLPLVCIGCIRFQATIPADPECVLATVAVVQGDPNQFDFEKPIADEPVAGGGGATVLVKVLQVGRPLQLQWLWYSPDNQLVRRSKAATINAKGKYLSYFAAWDTLPANAIADRKGTWTAVVTCDGAFLARKEFAVR